MNRQSIHQQIDLLLNALREQHEQFRESKRTIPQMELDLMLQNSQQLFESLLMLNHHNALSSLDEVKAAVTQRILAEKRAIEKKSEEVKTQPKPAEPVQQEAKQEVVAQQSKEEATMKAAVETAVEEKKEKAVKPKTISGAVNATLFESMHTLADKFEDEETLHSHIASKAGGQTVAENLHRKPIRDLKAAIGINEKFLFINQLFDGNLQDYSENIEKLNSAGSVNVAKEIILAELATRFSWKNEDPHVKSFLDLVERRFIA